MQQQEFYDAVSERADLSDTDAEDVTAAVLATLGERVTDGAATELERDLPDGIGGALVDEPPGEAAPFGIDEFLARVADRTDVPMGTARTYARAVLGTTTAAASTEAFDPVRDQLPDEFARILEPGEQIDESEFLANVTAKTDEELSDRAAEDATTATLRTLGHRLSKGEAADLATYLPPAYADALVADAPKTPPSFPAEAFVERVADQLDVEEERAEQRASAVLDTLVETAGETEMEAALSQLPDEYDRLFTAAD